MAGRVVTAPLRVGSLCSGYGGLEMGVELALGPIEHVWHGEFDAAASAVLAARWPGVPNIGDIAAVTAAGAWGDMAPIDILCAGYPCQPFSSAGLRKGTDDPRNRWPDVWEAVRALRPRLVVLENVRGHLSRGFDAVVSSLAGLGYLGRWGCVRASDTGAPHRRERLFIVAWPAEEGAPWLHGADLAGPLAELALLPTPKASDAKRNGSPGEQARNSPSLSAISILLPTPSACRAGNNRGGAQGRVGPVRPSLDQIGKLLPTPVSSLGRGSGFPSADTAADRRDNPARTFGLDDAVALLPTPLASAGAKGGPSQRGSKGDLALPAAVQDEHWGAYGEAVRRWEQVIGRVAPEPTIPGRTRPQLSPRFVEWMMGLPDGHVTGVIGKRTDALRVLGNGVVPQAAALALRQLLAEPEQPAWEQPELPVIHVAA